MTNVVIMKKTTHKAQAKIENKIILEEPQAEYTTISLPSFPYNIIEVAREGISKGSFMNFINKFNFTLRDVASILNLSERTLQRYDNTDKLSKDASERALHLQRLYKKGEEVFGSATIFNEWMKTSNLMFNNKTPIFYLDTIFGFEMIEDELGRIEHGIFA